MNTRFQGQKHVATGSTSNTSLPTVKKPRGRPRKNPLPPIPPIAPIIPPAFQGPRPRPPPLLNPVPYLPPGFRMEDEVENRPALQRNVRDRRMEEDEIDDPPARQNNVDEQRPIRDPPAPQRENRNYRYYDEEDDERPVGDYMTPTLEGNGSAIMPPDEDAFDFDVKSSLVHMVTYDQYQGVGNPSTHLANFQEYCRTYKPRNVPAEYVYLKLFPSSLYGDAKEWLQNQEPGTFRTWDHLANAFLGKFFPPSRTKKFTDFILTFSQRDNELFHQAYDRFKNYLRECPHHNFRKADLMRYFYLGMSKEAKNQMDTASGGAIMDLPAAQGFKIVDKIAINSDRYQGVDHKKMGKSREDSSNYATKDQINELSKRMETMISMVNSVEANYQYQQQGNYQGVSPQQPQAPTHQSTQDQSMTNILASLVANQAKAAQDSAMMFQTLQTMNQRMDEMSTHNKLLENQIAQQASSSAKYPGKLPSKLDFHQNEHVNAISLRSGTTYKPPSPKEKDTSARMPIIVKESKEEVEEEIPTPKEVPSKSSMKEAAKESTKEPPPYKPPMPFPQRQLKKNNESHFQKFAEMMKKINVTLPISKVISQMPLYSKFFKDVISHRREISEIGLVDLNEECSAIVQSPMPKKEKDPGSFSIPITIGNVNISKALCDLGANISLMPYSLYKKLDMGTLVPTSISLRLADRSSRAPC
ncbi:unnamed protein product [Rhodiola kirilowii]